LQRHWQLEKKHFFFESKLPLIVSVLIHAFAFLTFVLIEFRFIMTKEPVYLEIIFDEVTLGNSKEEIESEQRKIRETSLENINKISGPGTLVNKDYFVEKRNVDTLS
jgi:hypothetical protein